MRELKQSQTANIMILMVDDTDHVTGKTGIDPLAVDISKDGAAFVTETGNVTVTERTNGWYNIAVTTTHTNALGDLVVRATGTDADPGERISVVVANIESDTYTKVPSAVIGDYKADVSALALEATVGALNNISVANIEASSILAKETTLSTVADNILNIQGLVLHNHVEDDIVRDASGNKTSSILYNYDSIANATTHDKSTGLLSKYNVTVTYTGTNVTSLKVIEAI